MRAISLANPMIDLFWDPDNLAFFNTGIDHEHSFLRPTDPFDNALPSENFVSAEVLLELAIITENSPYSAFSETALIRYLQLCQKFLWGCQIGFVL
jgi:uncharacterized protein YyaL (SSP411 family)